MSSKSCNVILLSNLFSFAYSATYFVFRFGVKVARFGIFLAATKFFFGGARLLRDTSKKSRKHLDFLSPFFNALSHARHITLCFVWAPRRARFWRRVSCSTPLRPDFVAPTTTTTTTTTMNENKSNKNNNAVGQACEGGESIL